jgi:hypothetical protein
VSPPLAARLEDWRQDLVSNASALSFIDRLEEKLMQRPMV